MTTRQTVRMAAMSMAAAGLLCLGTGSPAWGQQQVEGGHALDRNLQKGSGGVNQAVRPQQVGAGNAVVTGNVPGLGYFHGDVGYTAPGEFRGSLGGDATFRFQAQSFSPNLGAPAGGTSMGNVQVYRSTSSPGVGQVGGGMTSISNLPNYLTGQSGGVKVHQGESSGVQGAWTSQSIPTGGTTVSSMGLVAGQDGRMLQISGSPLLGLRATAVGTAANQAAAGQAVQGMESATGVVTAPRTPAVPGLGQADNAAARVDAAMTPSPTGALPLDLRQSPLSAQEPTMTLEQQVAGIEARLKGPEGSMQAQPGQDVYMDLMRRVRQQKTGEHAPSADEPGAVPQDQLARPARPADGQQPDATGLPRDPLLDAMRFEPGKPAAPEPAPAAEDKTQDQAGDKGEETEKSEPKPGQQPAFEGPERRSQKTDGTGERAADPGMLKYKLPALPSLAGSDDTPVNVNLREAERLMQEGQFFGAVDRYRQASLMNPQDPMIMVGQVHAQMGAGMIRSAALNLRELLSGHPELIAARYEARLLPPKTRLEWLAEELAKNLEAADGQTAESGMLLAYMGYQTDNTSWLNQGLAAARQASPDDKLAALLEVIWTSATPTPAPRQDQAEPKQDAPAEAAPADEMPAEATPMQVVPMEAVPMEAAPAEAAPVEATPAEAAPATMPSEQMMLDLDAALDSGPAVEPAPPQAPEAQP